MSGHTIVLGARDVARFLPTRACIDAITETLTAHECGRCIGPASAGLTLPDGSVHAKMAAVQAGGRHYVVVKANINLPGNLERHGRPTIQGALILLDGADGQPLAVMDSIVLTSIRTAAVAALAAQHLALADARTITIIGCGEQGEAQLRAMTAVRRLRLAYAVDTNARVAQAFATRMADELGMSVTPTLDIPGAIARSEICVTCTTSKTPLIYAHHLHPGLFIAAIGADNPAKQEIDADVLARCRVVVDSLAACAAGGDLHHAISAGAMTQAQVYGELSAIVSGRLPGRTSRQEMFVFDSTGTALQDVAAAVLAYRSATRTHAGVQVMLDDRTDD